MLPIWLSKDILNIPSRAIEEAYGFHPSRAQNRLAKLRFADEHLLPIFLPLNDEQERHQYVKLRDRIVNNLALGNISMTI